MVGITGTNGKTTTAYLVDSAWRALGHVTGLIGTVETRVGDERVKSVRTTPESPDLHALLAVMRERGVRHLHDGGVQPRARAAPGRPGRLRRGRLHQPLPGPPRLPRDDGASTTPPRPASSPRSARAAASSASTTRGAGGWRPRRPCPVVTVTSAPTSTPTGASSPRAGDDAAGSTSSRGARRLPLRSALPGDFNRVNTAVAALVLAASGVADDDIVRAVHAEPHVPGRMERVRRSTARRRPAGGRRLRPHRRTRSPRPWAPCGRQTTGRAHRRPRCRWRPRPRQAAGDGRRRRDVRRRRRRHRRQPPVGGPRRHPRRGARRRPRGLPRADRASARRHRPARGRRPSPPRSAPPSRSPGRATPSPSSARATRPARRSTGPSTPSTTATSCAQP